MSVCYSAISRNIKTARKHAGKTQAEVAEAVSLSDLQYGRLERGAIPISLHHLCAIADALHISPIDLLNGAFPFSLPPVQAPEFYTSDIARLAQSVSDNTRRMMFEICYLLAADAHTP